MKHTLNVLVIGLIALLVPISASSQEFQVKPGSEQPRVRSGLEMLLADPPEFIRGKRVGLITNPTGVDADLRSGPDLLAARHDIHLVALFGPEHGVRGDAQDDISNGADARTGLPVFSLYGATRKPTPAMLRGLDALLFDIQDSGARFYTYTSTLALAMQGAAASDIPFVVLDRPDPLGGELVAGPVLDPRWSSFIGMYPIPVLYGMTMGELARLFNQEFGIGVHLMVIKMDGWHRSMWFDQTGLPWVMTSPGIPHFDTDVLYPVTGPIGDTSLSVGVLTTKPFEFVGAPYILPWHLREALEARHPGGVAFREVYWRGSPWLSTGGPEYGGVEIRVVDRTAYRPVDLMVQILDVVHRLYPAQFGWGRPAGSGYVFDYNMGTDQVRREISAGKPPAQIEEEWQPALAQFLKIREKYLLYP
jgi:uncharacterized protein YbbC (DUF1343 family)